LSCQVCEQLECQPMGNTRRAQQQHHLQQQLHHDPGRAHSDWLLHFCVFEGYTHLVTDFAPLSVSINQDKSLLAPSQKMDPANAISLWNAFFTGKTTVSDLRTQGNSWLFTAPDEGMHIRTFARIIQDNVLQMATFHSEGDLDFKFGLLGNVHRLPFLPDGTLNRDLAEHLIRSSLLDAHMWLLIDKVTIITPAVIGQFNSGSSNTQRVSFYYIIEFNRANPHLQQVYHNLVNQRSMPSDGHKLHRWGEHRVETDFAMKKSFAEDPRLLLWMWAPSCQFPPIVVAKGSAFVMAPPQTATATFAAEIALEFPEEHLHQVLDCCKSNLAAVQGVSYNPCTRRGYGSASYDHLQGVDVLFSRKHHWSNPPVKSAHQSQTDFDEQYHAAWTAWYKQAYKQSMADASACMDMLKVMFNSWDVFVGCMDMYNLDNTFDMGRQTVIINYHDSSNLINLFKQKIIDKVFMLMQGWASVTFGSNDMSTIITDPLNEDAIKQQYVQNLEHFLNHIRTYNKQQNAQRQRLPKEERAYQFPNVKFVVVSNHQKVQEALHAAGFSVTDTRVVYNTYVDRDYHRTQGFQSFSRRHIAATTPNQVAVTMTKAPNITDPQAILDVQMSLQCQLKCFALQARPGALPQNPMREIHVSQWSPVGFLVTTDDATANWLCKSVHTVTAHINNIPVTCTFRSEFYQLGIHELTQRFIEMKTIEDAPGPSAATPSSQPGQASASSSAPAAEPWHDFHIPQ